ncbi:metal ABC transporter permease [Hutsoniella sourekii]
MTTSEIMNLFAASYESWFILLLTAVTCGLIGCFLVLRQLSMISDAISHSVLLGIVLGYFIAGDLDSPLLILGAAAIGILTVWSTETLTKTGLVENDDAVGIIYPFFFAIAVILITRYAGNVHLDTDIVIMGEVILAPLNRVDFLGLSLPKALAEMGVLFLANMIFIGLFFKELKITTFDEQFGHLAGFNAGLLFYALMTLTSVTTVVAFDAVGAILVVAFIVGPGATAYLICKDLKQMLWVSVIYSVINASIGYVLAIIFNLSMGGMAATVTGLTFFMTFLFHREGLITSLWLRHQKSVQLKRDLVLLHIASHTAKGEEDQELKVGTLNQHFKWSSRETDQALEDLFKKDLIRIDSSQDIYQLTQAGRASLAVIQETYGI